MQKLQENLPELNQLDRRFMNKYELFHVPREACLLHKPFLQYTEHKCEDISKKVPTFGVDNGSKKIVAETIQLREPQQENIHDQSNCNYGEADVMASKEEDHSEVQKSCETKKVTEEFCIQIKSEDCDAASSGQISHETVKKRVTIHAYPHNAIGYSVQNGKLINLPGSMEELFEIGSK